MSSLVVTLLINHTYINSFKARLSILILSKTYPSGDDYITNL
jgi:hypothetical protein